jgi:hypothetical protein
MSADIDDGDEKKSQTCVDCGIASPSTDTNYTLISARHGWRLTPAVDKAGIRTLQWRCPACYARHKSQSQR